MTDHQKRRLKHLETLKAEGKLRPFQMNELTFLQKLASHEKQLTAPPHNKMLAGPGNDK